jgi:ABC-type transporter MlaC component
MKRIFAILCLSLALLHSSGAAEPATAQEQQIAALLKQLQEQQALIAANQAKIDAKLQTVAAAVRVARTFNAPARVVR